MAISTNVKVRSTSGSIQLVLLNVHKCNTPCRTEGRFPILDGKPLTFEYSLWCFIWRAKGGDDDDTGFGEVLYSWLRVTDGKKEAVMNFPSEPHMLS